jgi:hypothetical protein
VAEIIEKRRALKHASKESQQAAAERKSH